MGIETKELIELQAALDKRDAEIKEFCVKAQEEIKANGKITTETKQALEKLAEEGVKMGARLIDVEQKLARRGNTDPVRIKTWGETVAESEGVKSVMEGRSARSGRISVKAVTSDPGSAGALVRPERLPGIIGPMDRLPVVRDLIMPGRTASNSVEYLVEKLFTNNAAPTAENTLKPESNITFELATANVRTIAHWLPATKQILDDVPMLQSYIDGRMRYGLAYKEEQQMLLGDGTGQNLLGLIPQATAYSTALNKANDTRIDTIRHGVLQCRKAEYRASGVILNPADWEAIELTKDTTGNYIWSHPAAPNGGSMWRLPVVETTAMPEGKFMVGAFNMAAQVFDREDATVEISTEDRDNFVKNMVTLRAEERVALAVYRPQSFVFGTFA